MSKVIIDVIGRVTIFAFILFELYLVYLEKYDKAFIMFVVFMLLLIFFADAFDTSNDKKDE